MARRVAFDEKARFLLRQRKGRIMGVATGGQKTTKSALSCLRLEGRGASEQGQGERGIVQ